LRSPLVIQLQTSRPRNNSKQSQLRCQMHLRCGIFFIPNVFKFAVTPFIFSGKRPKNYDYACNSSFITDKA